jgi:hypothetical protein
MKLQVYGGLSVESRQMNAKETDLTVHSSACSTQSMHSDLKKLHIGGAGGSSDLLPYEGGVYIDVRDVEYTEE